MSDNKNQALAAKYFKPEEIASVKELGGRLIVTLKTDENAECAQQLKAELEQENPDKKVSVVFVKDRVEAPAASD